MPTTEWIDRRPILARSPRLARPIGLATAFLAVALASGGCEMKAPTNSSSSTDNSEAIDEEASSPGEMRRKYAALEIEQGRTDTFSLEADLSSIDAFQIDRGDWSLETNGTLALEPGFKAQLPADSADPAQFEYVVFDQPDVEVETSLQFDSPLPEMQMQSVDQTVSLCPSGGACLPTFEVDGTTYELEPVATLKVTASAEEPGSLRFGFEDNPERHYLKSGFEFDGQEGWHDIRSDQFDARPTSPDISDGFDGRADVQFDLSFRLQEVDHEVPLATTHLMEARNSIEARVRPPECLAGQKLEIGAAVERSTRNTDPTCSSGEADCLNREQLFQTSIFDASQSLQDSHPSCEQTTSRCTPGADECSGVGHECFRGYCVPKTPIQIGLRWSAPSEQQSGLDLDLDIQMLGEQGEMVPLEPLGASSPESVRGWIEKTSAGTNTDRDFHWEIAVIREVQAQQPLEFQVVAPDGVPEEGVDYTLVLENEAEFESPRTINGTITHDDSSFTYEMRPDENIGLTGE